MNPLKEPPKHALFQAPEGKISYCYFARGKKLLLFFPGYGQTQDNYKDWADKLPDNWSFLFVNHFEFCDSCWSSEKGADQLWVASLKNLVDSVHGESTKLCIGAFSLGNWLAAKAIESRQFGPTKWFIFASPGTGFSRLLWVSNHIFALKQLFSWFCKKPDRLILVASLLSKMRVIPEQRVRLLELQFGSSLQASQVYSNWKTMVNFIPNWKRIQTNQKSWGTEVLFLFGSADRITPGKNLVSYFSNWAKVVEYKGAHSHKNSEAFNEILLFLENELRVD